MHTLSGALPLLRKIEKAPSPGKLADMVVLSDNPLTVPPEQIKDMKVEMTIVDGKIVWEA